MTTLDDTLRTTKKFIPSKLFSALQPTYHKTLSFLAALTYRFPARKLRVVLITGTKGKSSTAEYLNSVLQAAGYKTALASTIRFKIGAESEANLYKMTIPGRFFVQKFLRKAANAQCDYAIVEMTSEGARFFRHAFTYPDALLFLNLAPEHIESHGSYENYVKAKLKLAEALEASPKKRKILVANADDKEAPRFLAIKIAEKYPFTKFDAGAYELTDAGVSLTFQDTKISSPLPGLFTVYNILAASTYALSQNIDPAIIKKGIESLHEIKGRVEKVTLPTSDPLSKKQNFSVVVDYAHTPDSLEQLYKAFPNDKKICILGNTGGGRDTWKRDQMAQIADTYCDSIILTDEDPYDDDPRSIIEPMAKAITHKPLKIIMDRRQAITEAIIEAQASSVSSSSKHVSVLISGKGTDPYIMRANGHKEPWSDSSVAREELARILGKAA